MIYSQSVLHNIQNGNIWHEWVPGTHTSHLQNLVGIYCPGHAEIQGNEQADLSALSAPVVGTLTMDKVDTDLWTMD